MSEPCVDKSLVQKLYALCPKAGKKSQARCWCPVCEAAYILDNIEDIEIPERDGKFITVYATASGEPIPEPASKLVN